MDPRQERLLRIAFFAGALTDAGALLPMLFPPLAHYRSLQRLVAA